MDFTTYSEDFKKFMVLQIIIKSDENAVTPTKDLYSK